MKKNVIVTGATGGIGKAICSIFSKDFNIFVIGRDLSRLKVLSQENKAIKGFFSCDLKDHNGIGKVIQKILNEFSSIDILVNNAGATDDSLFIRMDREKWQNVIDTNLNSNFFLTNLVARNMIKKRWGRIINITSIVGHTGNVGQANYSASKSGIIGMSKSIALELAKRNITVNCISPGFIETKMTNVLSEEQKEKILNQIPTGKIGSPEDVANSVFFLASDGAAYITGQTIHVNGGMTMI